MNVLGSNGMTYEVFLPLPPKKKKKCHLKLNQIESLDLTSCLTENATVVKKKKSHSG